MMRRSLLFMLFPLAALFFQALHAQEQSASLQTEQAHELSILSWNIHMLPSLIYRKTKKNLRAKEIARELQERDYNIIVFQEAFQKKARKTLWSLLKDKYPYSYGPHNRKLVTLKANSGIWVLSDRPLSLLEGIDFDDCASHGCMGRQGALMFSAVHEGKQFQIIGTHTNGGRVNASQFKQIRDELLLPFEQRGIPQLICGDFNIKRQPDNKSWLKMLKTFEADGGIQQTDARNAEHKAFWPSDDLYDSWPDFIFIRRNGSEMLQVNNLSTISIGPTWTQGKMRKSYPGTVGLSDHYPVEIRMQWRE